MAENIDILVKLVDEASGGLQHINDEISGMNEATTTASKNMIEKLGGIEAVTKKIGTAFTIAGAAIIAGAGLAIKNSSDLAESINAVNVIFSTASDTIFKFGETSAQSAGLSKRAFFEAVTPIGAMLQNMGFSASEAADQSVILAQRAADMASVFNTDLSQALTAIQAGLRGEADPIERFGVGLSETAVKAYAVSQGMIGLKEDMDAQTKTVARLGLFMEQTDAIAGDFANTSDGLANKSRILTADLEDLNAMAGTALKPILEAILKVIVPIVESIGNWVEMNPMLAQTVIIVTAGLGALLVILGPLVILLGSLATLSTAIGITMLPLTLIILGIGLAIGLLIAGVVLLITHWDWLKQKTGEVWDWVKIKTGEAKDFIVAKLTELWVSITAILTAIWNVITTIFNGITAFFTGWIQFVVGLILLGFEAMGIDIFAIWESIKEGIVNAFNLIKDHITMKLEELKTAWITVWGFISTFLSTIWGVMKALVIKHLTELSDFFKPAVEALRTVWTNFWTGAGVIVTSIWDSVKGTVKSGINWVLEQINKAINAVNSVMAKGAAALGMTPIKISTIPLLAKGGDVVSAGSAMVGENGPEILSLPRGARVTPLTGNNSVGSGGVTIVINNPTVMNTDDIMDKIGNPIMEVFKQHFAVV